MNRTTCPNGMVDTCCENYDDCTLSYYDKDAEIKRLNEKIEFLADKLESWRHMNGLRWDDQIAKLKEKNNG